MQREKLHSINLVSFCRDFAHKLSLALIANGNTLLHTIDLSNNLIEDKGSVREFSKIIFV